jgi:cardiolipin synthase
MKYPDLGDRLEDALPSLAGTSHGGLVPGNRVEILQNGDGFFPRLLADIAAARQTVHLESFVWWRGEICRRVAEALAERAEHGVEVRLLVDAMGGRRMEEHLRRRMEGAGCKVVFFRPLRPSRLAWINCRDHRKVVVIDGRLGYICGHGIADEWLGDAQDEHHWRDTAARVEGPIVHSLQACFGENWTEETGEVLAGVKCFARLEPAGETAAHLTYYFQHGSASAVEILYRLAFCAAQKELLVQNPYMVPDVDILDNLASAVKRGAEVKVMVPGRSTDAQIVRHAGHFLYGRLLERGVRIFEYTHTLSHQKVIVVDGLWSHLGSTNFDDRSFESNDEVSLGIVDPAIAAELKAAFDADLKHCVEVRLEDWRGRSWRHRLLDALCYSVNEFL